jgi:hypothetical protein
MLLPGHSMILYASTSRRTMQAIETWNITPRPPSVHAVIMRIETTPDIYDSIARF